MPKGSGLFTVLKEIREEEAAQLEAIRLTRGDIAEQTRRIEEIHVAVQELLADMRRRGAKRKG